MSLRLLYKQNRRPSNALFHFRQGQKTGIAPTRIIIEKQLDLTVGMVVTVNWDGEKVEAEILALDGKFRLVHSSSNCWIPWVSEVFHAQFSVSSLQSDLLFSWLRRSSPRPSAADKFFFGRTTQEDRKSPRLHSSHEFVSGLAGWGW